MDYFSIKQGFYTGNFKQSLQAIAKHNKVEDETLEYYRLRNLLALKQYQKTDSALGAVFDAYAEFLKSGDLATVAEIAQNHKSPFAQNLLACAQGLHGDFEDALKTCQTEIDEDEGTGISELVLLAVQLAILAGQSSTAEEIYRNYMAAHEDLTSDDEIVLNFCESYLHFARGEETTGSNFYFYEELCQTSPSWKTQLGLLTLQLQQSNIPEARAIVDLLESEFYQNQKESADAFLPDLLANKITLGVMEGNNVDQLRTQLADVDAGHQFCKDHKANSLKLDQIIAKYK
ncbi:LAMI_0E10836g1_1 [Lachancea mirantina]|uniref:Coatomer subunit epsilon n=1 Tax=Lachancea mirantina TaxID=1230905 RepID=A0A1G4JP60_9SACH|nr:LAMI_0E10836g1_1 [Lachancea mirantina]